MKLSLQKVVGAWVSIRNIEKDKGTTKWAYAIARNKGKMQPEIDGVIAAEKEVNEIEQERLKYCHEHATKDNAGKPVVENGAFIGIDGDAPEFVAILDRLKKAYEEKAEFMKTEVEIDLHQVSFDDVPAEIAPLDLENLLPMIKEPEEKK